MRLASFTAVGWPPDVVRVGWVDSSLGEITDVTLAVALHLGEGRVGRASLAEACRVAPPNMRSLLEDWNRSSHAIRAAVGYLRSVAAEQRPAGFTHRLTDVALQSPVRPGKIVHTGSNFVEHHRELEETSLQGWDSIDWQSFSRDVPTGFLISPDSLIGSGHEIVKPRRTNQLDYEIEIAAIIGRPAKDVLVDEAEGYIAGYAVFNDISARDIQLIEHRNHHILLGKSMDTFSPLGPWLVTPDEIADVQRLRMELRVNGDPRQVASTSGMHFSMAELVSYWSQATLYPGDVVTSGTPQGVAAYRKPDPSPFFLQDGDLVEATVECLGTLANRIADEA